MLSMLGGNFGSIKCSRSMSWFVMNKLRDTSTISPRSVKKREPRERKPRTSGAKPKPKFSTKDWLLECKRPEYNLPKNVDIKICQESELASHAWFNRHSNGDYFTIHATEKPNDIQNTVAESFHNTTLSPEVVCAVNKLGYQNPTTIQWLGLPPILEGRHTLLAAETGCGKTLAYLLPIIQQVLEWKPFMPEKLNAPLALIIAPNRELVKQIYDVVVQLTENLPINPFHLIGGSTKKKMIESSYDMMDILVATPSVVSKLTSIKLLDMHNVRHAVLDEADTLLDDSFNGYIKNFLGKLPISSQCLRVEGKAPEGAQLTFASATFPTDIDSVLSGFMNEDSFEKISTPGLHKLMPQITQTFYRMGKIHKPEHLLKYAKQLKVSKTPTLIFSNKNSTSSFITHFLAEYGVDAPCYCGNMPANIRNETFEKFQSGETKILSTTDIGSRGLNTVKAQVVLNYDFPLFKADYLHRCGRVGRIDSKASGKVVNFVNGPAEIKVVQAIERATRNREQLHKVDGNISRIIEDWRERQESGEVNSLTSA